MDILVDRKDQADIYQFIQTSFLRINRMLDINKFRRYRLSEKFELINNGGKYLGVRECYNNFIHLYLVEDTFIEVSYFPTENKIAEIEILEDEEKLDLYIDYMINLEKLNNLEHYRKFTGITTVAQYI